MCGIERAGLGRQDPPPALSVGYGMDDSDAYYAVWRRLQAIQQEYRLILQELRHTPPTDYERRVQLIGWARDCAAEYTAVFRQWHDRPSPS